MEIWFACEKEEIQLPILPPSFAVSVGGGHQTIVIHTYGEVLLMGKRGLKTLEISSFFPGQDYPFAVYPKDREPAEYVKKINGWLQKTVHVTITAANIDTDFVITSFQYSENSVNDIEFTISFMEYRMPGIKRKTKKKAKTYTVKKGDTLKTIAKKTTGSSSNASKIYKKNKSVIEKAAKKRKKKSSKNGKFLYPGTKLVIP